MYLYFMGSPRINGIESGRLDRQLQILERQKLHTVRLVNQNIRVTKITLEHIEACSGRSVEQAGFWGMTSNADDEEDSDKPMFLYGERKVSRRVGKFRRIQSAMTRGRKTSDLATDLVIEKARPKSSIPTFSEIKQRVEKQLDANPEWDPNVELPYEPGNENTQEKITPTHAWVDEKAPTESGHGYTLKNSRKQSAVSFKDDMQRRRDNRAEDSRTPPDGASVNSDVIETINKETAARNNMQSSSSSRPSTGILKTKGVITKRRSACSAKSGKSSQVTVSTVSEAEELEESTEQVNLQPGLSTKELIAKVETQEKFSQNPAVKTQKRNPRDHPTFQLVNQARVLASKAKKSSNSQILDPEFDKTGPRAAREQQRKLDKLNNRRGLQDLENVELDVKVSEYLIKHPAIQDTNQNAPDPLVPYDKVRNTLKERQIPLIRAEKVLPVAVT